MTGVTQNIGIKTLHIVIIIWIIIAGIRTVYNLTKVVTEEKSWISLSAEGKKLRAYGDNEIIYTIINSRAKSSDCVIVDAKDTSNYFLLRYLLYPVKIYDTTISSHDTAAHYHECHFFLFLNKNISEKNEIVSRFLKNQTKVIEIPNKQNSSYITLLLQIL